jgi:drug/metabolite transporter (DMT)-like permease
MWVIFSFVTAISQAMGNALNKKALQKGGVVNFVGFAAYLVSGVIFGIIIYSKTGEILPELANPARFFMLVAITALLLTSAVFFQLKALEIADLSFLMPYFSLTAVLVIIPSFLMLGELPTLFGFAGIVLIVAGAIVMNYSNKKSWQIETDEQNKKRQANKKGLIYFLISMVTAFLVPVTLKLSIKESSVIFTSFIMALLVSAFFLTLIFIFRERNKIKEILVFNVKSNRLLLSAVILSGLLTAVEFGTMNKAFSLADVSYVMAIKRTMPFFAFLIGYFYFNEKANISRKIIATSIMVLGAILVILLG